MAEDPQLASNKRKYDDGGSTPIAAPRRASGFSSGPIASPSPDSKGPTPTAAYNNVPPPADEFQLAKQRAQEIAARLFSDAEAKRPRVENGPGIDGGADKGFGSADYSHKPLGLSSQAGVSPVASYAGYGGYQSSNRKIEIPNARVGVIIGKSGETIKYLQMQSGAKIQVTRDMDADPNSDTRLVELSGTADQISKAEQLIKDVLDEAESGGSGLAAARRHGGGSAGTEQFALKVPNNKVGLVIGKGGETIKNMQASTGARIQVIPLRLPPGDMSTERTVQIDGTPEQIEAAKQLINDVISENRPRNQSMSGGYSQQGYHPPRPQPSWGPPGAPPMQQASYGYMQPGAYPGPPSQYNISQTPYAGYPPAPPSSGYASGWDQSSNQQSQHATSGTGQDYYNQQQQPPSSAPSDASTYNYSQPQPSSYSAQGSYGDGTYSQQPVGQQQGYGQDGYASGYPASQTQGGYTHPPPTAQTGYDQQQSYGGAPAYNTTQDGSATGYGAPVGSAQGPQSQQAPPAVQPPASQQGYATQQPSNAPPPYSSQANPAGYSMPATSQQGYGGQLPVQAGYGQPAPLNPPYGQPPAGQKPATTATYSSPTPTGYAQPGYGQPPPAQSAYPQPAYGQQQSYGGAPQGQAGYGAPQSYADSYGAGGYALPVYSSDTTAGGSVHGASAAAQSATGGVTKASPQAQS